MSKLAIILGLLLASNSAFSAAPLVCSSETSKFGGFSSITITEQDGKILVSGHASGGMAKWATVFGPFEATVTSEGDAVKYTFVDQFGQTGSVTLVTTVFSNQLLQSAISDYGFWAVGSLSCK